MSQMNYSDARKAIREGCLALLEQGPGTAEGLLLTEYRTARAQYSRNHWEQGPGWETEPQKCGSPCPLSGTWGATGIMPVDHFWYWQNEDRTGGYLAHKGTGKPPPAPPGPDALDTLIEAAYAVADIWETGDLGRAVNDLQIAAHQAERQLKEAK